MSYRILYAEDEYRMRLLVEDFLANQGYDLVLVSDGQAALDTFYASPDFDLVILDVMMPKMNGYEVCEEIRKMSQVPIVMLTAKDTEKDELAGFGNGADEYIKKPFSPSILVARVKALLQRHQTHKITTTLSHLTVDYDRHRVEVDGQPVDLSQTEFKLLSYLIENESKVLSREQILNQVWGYDYFGTDRTVDTHMNRLRTKLEVAGDYIKTVRGYGYKFERDEGDAV